MAELTVFGASDDLVEVSGIDGADEFSAPGNSRWTGVLEAPNGETALLYVDYRKNGTWTAALGLFEEGYKLPSWPVKVETNELNDYSTFTTITVPDGTKITDARKVL